MKTKTARPKPMTPANQKLSTARVQRVVRRDKPAYWYRALHGSLWDVFDEHGKPIARQVTRREAASLLMENWDENGRTISFA